MAGQEAGGHNNGKTLKVELGKVYLYPDKVWAAYLPCLKFGIVNILVHVQKQRIRQVHKRKLDVVKLLGHFQGVGTI